MNGVNMYMAHKFMQEQQLRHAINQLDDELLHLAVAIEGGKVRAVFDRDSHNLKFRGKTYEISQNNIRINGVTPNWDVISSYQIIVARRRLLNALERME